MSATLAELEARVAALEAERVDYRAVLAAVNALGENQRDLAVTVREQGQRFHLLVTKVDDTNARVRSIEEGQAEIKDLLVAALDRRGGE